MTAQRRAIASVLSQASGRSANSARMTAAGLNQCSGVTRRRSRSDSRRPSAMQSRASCASYIDGLANRQSLVATSGMPAASASAMSPGSMARSTGRPWRCSSIAMRSAKAACRSREQALGLGALAFREQARDRTLRCRRSAGSGRHARSQIRASGSCGLQPGRSPGSPPRTGAAGWRNPRRPWPAARPGRAAGADCRARVTDTWQPMIGCTPGRRRPGRIRARRTGCRCRRWPTAGMAASRARAAILSALIAPSLSE